MGTVQRAGIIGNDPLADCGAMLIGKLKTRTAGAEQLALAGGILLVVLHIAPIGAALEYQRDLLGAQAWRALSAHMVHINWPHVLVNAAAWWVVARLFAPELPARRQLLSLLAGALAISGGLYVVYPAIAWYRGFSGVLHALFFAGAATWLLRSVAGSRSMRTLWLPVLLLAGGWIKVVLEQPSGGTTPFSEWLGAATVPQAHLLGALAGTVIGAFFSVRPPGSAGE